MTLRYDSEFLKAVEPLLAGVGERKKPAVHDIEGRRKNVDNLLGPLWRAIPLPSDVEVKIYHTTASDGFSIPIYHMYKKGDHTSELKPAIVHTHGGGYISISVATLVNNLATTVAATGVQMFSVDYRLAPEHPFPTPVEDCYAGLNWVHENAKELNVNPARLAVYGESAGGGLAAGLAIMARDRQLSPPLAKQILIYPMIDDRNLQPTPNDHLMFWTYEDNITGWTAYVGENAGKEGVSPYAAAARVESVEGLPSTYIDVGGLDFFLGEDMEYATRLVQANVEVEFHLYPGVPHAFELLGKGIDVVKKALQNRQKAMVSF